MNILAEVHNQLGGRTLWLLRGGLQKYPSPSSSSTWVPPPPCPYLGNNTYEGASSSGCASPWRLSLRPGGGAAPHLPERNPLGVGRSTIDAMRSGVLYGNAGMIDSMIQRMEEAAQPAAVVMTGATPPSSKSTAGGDPHRREPPRWTACTTSTRKTRTAAAGGATLTCPQPLLWLGAFCRVRRARPAGGPPGSRGQHKDQPLPGGKTWSSAVGAWGRWPWARARRTRGEQSLPGKGPGKRELLPGEGEDHAGGQRGNGHGIPPTCAAEYPLL